MTTDATTPRSTRRGLLAAGLGAAAAAVAASVARIHPASAADGDVAIVGGDNLAENATRFTTDTTIALVGASQSGKGVSGKSTSSQGVHGESTEVAGVAGLSVDGVGVHGRSTSNRGVQGQSETGAGVEGSGATGVEGSGGIGVKASSTDGYAIQTMSGRLRFEGISGVAVIEEGETETFIEPPIDVNDNTIMLLTGQADNGGRSLWFSRNQDEDKLFIRMSEPRNNFTRIAYLILEHA